MRRWMGRAFAKSSTGDAGLVLTFWSLSSGGYEVDLYSLRLAAFRRPPGGDEVELSNERENPMRNQSSGEAQTTAAGTAMRVGARSMSLLARLSPSMAGGRANRLRLSR